MTNVKVSIIIPFYNRNKNIMDRCIYSVLKQTYSNYECLIIDDGSKEDNSKFLSEYENLDARIKVYHKPNGGAGSARNFGVLYADGEYVYFLDSDDYISPYTLEVGMRLASKTDADMIVGGLIHINADEEAPFQNIERGTVTVQNREDKLALILHFSGIKQQPYIMHVGATGTSPCSRFVRRTIAMEVRFENDKFWDEDDLWNISLVDRCNKIIVADICWYAYVINPDSMVRGYAGDRTEEFQIRSKQEYERIKTLWPECMQGAYHHIWDGLLRYCRTDTFQPANPKNMTERYKDFCKAMEFVQFDEAIHNIDFSYEKRLKYKMVKTVLKRMLLLRNKKPAFIILKECIRRIKF